MVGRPSVLGRSVAVFPFFSSAVQVFLPTFLMGAPLAIRAKVLPASLHPPDLRTMSATPVFPATSMILLAVRGRVRSVEHAIGTLRTALYVAVDMEMIARCPIRKVPRFENTTAAADVALTEQQYRALITACRKAHHVTLVRVAAEGGLRRGELVALRWADLDLTNGFIHVQRSAGWTNGRTLITPPKSKKSRHVAIPHDLCALLATQRADNDGGNDDPVWPSRNGVMMHPHNLNDRMSRIFRWASLTDEDGKPIGNAHTLRRTGATLASLRGIPNLVIQRQLGHTQFKVTAEHYLKLPDVTMLTQYADSFR